MLSQLRWSAGLALVTVLLLFVIAGSDLDVSLALKPYREHMFGALMQEHGRRPASLLVVVAAAVLTQRRWRQTYPLASRALAASLVQLVLHAALLTNAIKMLAGRPRPASLGPLGEGFVPVWSFHPAVGDFSFPSGHVAVSMLLAPAALATWQAGRRRVGGALAIATLLWSSAMAFARVLSGAHFPTDVVFSIGVGLALAPLSVSVADAFGRRQLA